jgi:hypothetical protein
MRPLQKCLQDHRQDSGTTAKTKRIKAMSFIL